VHREKLEHGLKNQAEHVFAPLIVRTLHTAPVPINVVLGDESAIHSTGIGRIVVRMGTKDAWNYSLPERPLRP